MLTMAQRSVLLAYADPSHQDGSVPPALALEIRQARHRGGSRARGQALSALSRVVLALGALGLLEFRSRDRPTTLRSLNGKEYPMFEEARITEAGLLALGLRSLVK